ncbi:hypothetical protein [Roseomonas chloroacetimidivorans]|uniref:hypothetical protein n=1 Tax=Roseomonas chloroacetimidivorans TaxID=1766656 RepID=UPI003C7572B2
MTVKAIETRRERDRERAEEYRSRRRRGAMAAWVEVEAQNIRALERLGLLELGEREPKAVGAAVSRFLATAGAVAAIGDSLYPPGTMG